MKNNESKREKFKRLASKRTNEVLNKLGILGNCASRSGYDYTSEDVEKIFDAIEEKVKKTRLKFSSGLVEEEETEFKL